MAGVVPGRRPAHFSGQIRFDDGLRSRTMAGTGVIGPPHFAVREISARVDPKPLRAHPLQINGHQIDLRRLYSPYPDQHFDTHRELSVQFEL
jgi:hypothetical protein